MRIALDLTKFQVSSNNSISRAPRAPHSALKLAPQSYQCDHTFSIKTGSIHRTPHKTALRTSHKASPHPNPTPAPAKYPKQPSQSWCQAQKSQLHLAHKGSRNPGEE